MDNTNNTITSGSGSTSSAQQVEDYREYKLKNNSGVPLSSLGWIALIITSLLYFVFQVKLYIVLFTLLCIATSEYLYFRGRVKEESLIIVRELGVQLQTKYVSGKERHVFIDKKRIKSIIINEGIASFSVIFYMAFVVDRNDKMILAFQNTYPRLKTLLPIYRGTRAMIFGELEYDDQD